MKGVVFLGDRKLELREFPDPTPGPRDVILEIKASGMCGTDLHTYRAPAQPGGAVAGGIKRQAGVIAGHEPCGVVAAVGAGVSEKEARVGERVMDHHYDGCGTCKHCRAGWTQMCLEGSVVYGSGGHGGHARYMKVPVSTLVPLPDALSFVTGAAISCGTGTAWGALRRLNLQGGETIAIFGQGPVGLSATQLAVVMGARVIACASSDDKLAFARQRGADETVNYDREDLRGALKKLGGERGIDVGPDGQIGRDAQRIGAARALERGDGLVERPLPARQHGDARAFGGEALGRGATHAFRSTADDGGGTREPEVHAPTSLCAARALARALRPGGAR